MAIVENRSTEIGDIIVIQTEVPIVGLLTLQSFVYQTTGEDDDKFFIKEFRFSKDGISFSNWIELTQENIDSIVIESTGLFEIEYRFIRAGTDDTGELTYENSTLTGLVTEAGIGPIYGNSIFNQFFTPTDLQVLTWQVNVTEKLYLGIIPQYIIRNDESEDIDYLAFWRSVALFFAYFTKFIKTITGFTTHQQLLHKYLADQGVFLCKEHTIQELIYITNRYFDQIRQRGTLKIIEKKDNINILADGEFLRLICYNPIDEFIFNLHPPQFSGWVVNSNSPLYKGTAYHPNINKNYDNQEDITDLAPYPTIGSEYLDIAEEGGHNVLRILNVSGSDQAGIFSDFSTSIPVDENINYEISFIIKQPSLESNFTFSVEGYDINGNVIGLLNSENGSPRNHFLQLYQFPRNDLWYKVSGIIYGTNRSNLGTVNSLLNIGVGRKLRFQEGIVKIGIRIFADGGDGVNELLIYNLRIQPASFPFGTGFVQLPNLITCWIRNRNDVYSNNQIIEITRKYLVPYNSVFVPIFLDVVALPDSTGEEEIPEDIILLNQDTMPLLNQDETFIILEYATGGGVPPDEPSGNNAYPATYPFVYE